MANLTPARTTDRPALAHTERREVVIEHEFLAVFVREAIHPLLISHRAQGRCHQRLRFTTLEDGRTMRAGQDAYFTGDLAKLLIIAAVDARAFQDQVPNDALLQLLEGGRNLLRREFW